MRDKDAATKAYMQDNRRFADAFNFYLYDGRQVIRPENLKPLDPNLIAAPYGKGQKSQQVERMRDLLKHATIMQDDRATYILLGIENQTNVHYAMPIRTMVYDAMQYEAQIKEVAMRHRAANDVPESGDEYLSGFYKEDRLLPVFTLTIYYGPEPWDGPLDLHSMLDADKAILKFIPNYKLNLLAPARIAEDELEKFHTDLLAAFTYMKFAKDKARLRQLVAEKAKAFQLVSRETVDMLNTVMNAQLPYEQGKENINMCEAMEGMLEDARQEGWTGGWAEGVGIGREEGKLDTLFALVRKGYLTLEQAAEEAHMSPEAFAAKVGFKQ